jgi:hypothetical protein
MERTGGFRAQLQTAGARYFFLLYILLTLDACGASFRPLYFQGPEGYGLQHIQLDEDTYFIAYMDYSRNIGGAYGQKLLQLAQEYVLYRAGEVAKSRGAKYFVVLHKDDWNFMSELKVRKSIGNGYRRFNMSYDDYDPGAGVVMRLVHDSPSSTKPNDDRFYEVDMLLQQLPKQNRALADYVKKFHDESLIQSGSGFHRWRSSIHEYDSVDAFERKYKSLYGRAPHDAERNSAIETKVVPQATSDQFELSISDMRLIAPLRLLVECVKLADQNGYEAFKVVDWTVEEHFVMRPKGRRYMWFRTTATIILQHQTNLESLEPVFSADKIRKNIEVGQLWPLNY